MQNILIEFKSNFQKIESFLNASTTCLEDFCLTHFGKHGNIKMSQMVKTISDMFMETYFGGKGQRISAEIGARPIWMERAMPKSVGRGNCHLCPCWLRPCVVSQGHSQVLNVGEARRKFFGCN